MKKILAAVAAVVLFAQIASANLATNIYIATGTSKTSDTDIYVAFNLIGFTGTIGGAAFSNVTTNLQAFGAFQTGAGIRLNAINYIVTSGTLVITEVK